MDYELLIFEPASIGVQGLFLLFIIVVILDYIRSMIFSER